LGRGKPFGVPDIVIFIQYAVGQLIFRKYDTCGYYRACQRAPTGFIDSSHKLVAHVPHIDVFKGLAII
jgi:hypothetical protein